MGLDTAAVNPPWMNFNPLAVIQLGAATVIGRSSNGNNIIGTANTASYYMLPMVSFADDANKAWNNGQYIRWAGNISLGAIDGFLFIFSLGSTSLSKSLIKGGLRKGTRGLWVLSKEYASTIKSHTKWGTFYKSKSDGLWWALDRTGHGGSKFKVFTETPQGLQWYRDADQYGDFIIGKHKAFIPWSELKTAY